MASTLKRRGSSQSSHVRKKPTRSDSGREFWGLPEVPKKHAQLEDTLEVDSSEEESEEEDEEWVSIKSVWFGYPYSACPCLGENDAETARERHCPVFGVERPRRLPIHASSHSFARQRQRQKRSSRVSTPL
jgi:hypothetical protein